MTELLLKPGVPWRGIVNVPSSKSVGHRMLICASLAGEPLDRVEIAGTPSEDLSATRQCLEALRNSEAPLLNCKESGSTLRFLLPVAAALGKRAEFRGEGRLPDRPIGMLLEQLAAHGVEFSASRLPLRLAGRLSAENDFQLPGDVSSQFITGLLLALPMTEQGGGNIRLTTQLESKDYVALTIAALKLFGVAVEESDRSFRVPLGSRLRAPGTAKLSVEGDWSGAAFPLVAGALAGEGLALRNLNPDSAQGDKRVVELLRQFGAEIRWSADGAECTVRPGCRRAVPEIDVRAIPDMVPALAVMAGVCPGTTRFTHAGRLRLKESDRLAATAEMLRALGGKAEVLPDDCLEVTGVPQYAAGGVAHVDGCNDHRMVMATAVAAVAAANEISVTDPHAVAKSWPDFWEVREAATRL